jgi:two-component system cell cycle sensor histidine kinase/response regulator CckA
MAMRLNVLMAGASATEAERVADALRREGYDAGVEQVERPAEMTAALDRQRWDLLLVHDSGSAPSSSLDALAVLRLLRTHDGGRWRDLPLIILADASAPLDLARIREALQDGARDYAAGDDLPRLLTAIGRELRDRADREEQRRTEASLRQTQKLEAIGQLAGGVAHDFNNLLTAILAYSESLLYQLPVESPLRIEVGEIRKSGERAATLTRQLLAFGRRRAFKPHVASLNALVAGLEPTLRRMLGDHVEVYLQLAPDLGPVRIDIGQFEQAILNLAMNARDAMPAGGSLTLRTTNVDLCDPASRLDTDAQARAVAAPLPPGWYVSLTVTDSGCGMDASTQARAFEPFFTTHETGQGTGLGLAIVYGTIRQSGGNIAIESEVGRGTTMRLLLPRALAEVDTPRTAAAAAGTASATTAAVSAAGGVTASGAWTAAAGARTAETILLVEDDELVRQMAELTLERRGYRVLLARDAAEAIAGAQTHPGEIDVLVVDLLLPRLNGRELARVLREARPALRMLFTVGSGDDDLAREAAASDPQTAFLQKPFVATALAERVRDLLARQDAAPPAPPSPEQVHRRGEH